MVCYLITWLTTKRMTTSPIRSHAPLYLLMIIRQKEYLNLSTTTYILKLRNSHHTLKTVGNDTTHFLKKLNSLKDIMADATLAKILMFLRSTQTFRTVMGYKHTERPWTNAKTKQYLRKDFVTYFAWFWRWTPLNLMRNSTYKNTGRLWRPIGSPAYANVFMGKWERTSLKRSKNKIQCLVTFLDDIFMQFGLEIRTNSRI